MREPGSGTRHAIEQHLRRRNETVSVRMTIESNEAIKHAVMSGLGIAILSAHTLAFGGRSGMAELDIKGLPIDSHWYVVRKRDRHLSVVARAFLDFLQTEGQDSVLAELRKV